MVSRPTPSSLLFLAVAASLAGCGGGSNVSNASPRVSEIPQQSTTGASAFTLQLGDYLTDREGATLTYSVTSGGGSFAGSIYSNTFDTMGEYEVEFAVTDGDKTSTGTIPVRVTQGHFAVVREDSSGLLLLDTRTDATVRIAGATSTPSIGGTLADGRLAYHLAAGTGQQLWVFDPLKRTNVRVAAAAGGSATYRAKTSDGKIVYTAGTGNELEIGVYNPTTGVRRVLSTAGLSTVTALVNSADLVFYEVSVNGQADIYAYDVAADESFAVGEATTDEQLLQALPNGGVLFSRVGASGEQDIFYYRVSTGLVEVGADQSALASLNKVLAGVSTDSKVVFTAEGSGTRAVWAWNPANGTSVDLGSAVSASAWNTVVAVGAGNEVAFQSAAFGNTTESDAFFYDLDTATGATLRNSSDLSTVLAVSSDGTTGWAFIRPSGTASSILAVSMVASPATQTWAAGGATSTTLGVLTNGDVVGQRADGGALALFDVSAGTWGTPITGTGLLFEGNGLDAGDFVYRQTVSSQSDLAMWDASGATSVTISDTAGNDVFQAKTADASILFTRVVSGNTNADLFVWDGTTATRLTNADAAGIKHDHSVLGQYTGAR